MKSLHEGCYHQGNTEGMNMQVMQINKHNETTATSCSERLSVINSLSRCSQ